MNTPFLHLEGNSLAHSQRFRVLNLQQLMLKDGNKSSTTVGCWSHVAVVNNLKGTS